MYGLFAIAAMIITTIACYYTHSTAWAVVGVGWTFLIIALGEDRPTGDMLVKMDSNQQSLTKSIIEAIKDASKIIR